MSPINPTVRSKLEDPDNIKEKTTTTVKALLEENQSLKSRIESIEKNFNRVAFILATVLLVSIIAAAITDKEKKHVDVLITSYVNHCIRTARVVWETARRI
ncbi:hypothetical protein ESCO_000242 [Escovopsis weberi]|uniref:Uncharacterized protein n=1 Tax=Escovopsis weberi TaxID=150374 RepID=A0A0M8N366_ESCWE|nr:hypothetical protein ESCO_000242 [Escovopsis weberi]